MSSRLGVECPECHAAPGILCVNRTTGEYMGVGHVSRKLVALIPDGDVGALDPDDPDVDIAPLGDIAPVKQIDYTKDHYPDRTVLRWSRTYGASTYIYVAIKATGVGWFLSGKATDAIPWDELWNKHLTKSDWLERADHWEDIHVIHDR
jgi:hypothetical protein